MRFLRVATQITENEFQDFCVKNSILDSYDGRTLLFNYLSEIDKEECHEDYENLTNTIDKLKVFVREDFEANEDYLNYVNEELFISEAVLF